MSNDEAELVLFANLGGMLGTLLFTLLAAAMGVLGEIWPSIVLGWALGTLAVNAIMLLTLRK
jgi:hypothetical protein